MRRPRAFEVFAIYSPLGEAAMWAAMWRKMLSPILWAGLGLVCVMFTSPTSAAAAPDDPRSSSAPANAAPARGTGIKSEHPGDLRPPRTGAQSSAVSSGRNSAGAAPRPGFAAPQHGIHQSAGASVGRVRAPLNTQPRGRPAGQTSRPIGPNRAATGIPGLGGPGASKRNAMPVPKATAVAAGNSQIGGPRVQSIGRLGGAAMGRTNHSAAIDGTQFRRKF
jgi:hypothetical protein